jgi:prepilin-type N-terminal cleavage/methylation domain-containing protein
MKNQRTGFSLIEVMVVLVVLAVVGLASQMLAPISASRSVQAATESRKLVAALRMARQTAVSNQTPVRLRVLGSTRAMTGYVIEQQLGGAFVPITSQEPLSGLPTMTSNAASILFAPTGSSDVSLVATFNTGRQTHEVSVVAATGLVRYVRR